jgi:formiminotetrahydrofolate cyclodeaminase
VDDHLTDVPTRQLIERLATSEPIPGGGSAAALAGAMAAALVEMVVALSTGRPAATDHEAELADLGHAASAARAELMRLVQEDADAYAEVVRARRLPRGSDMERRYRGAQVHAATRDATLAPLATARSAASVLDLTERLAPIGNRNAASDVGVAALLAVTAIRGAALNVRINLPGLAADDPLRDDAAAAIDALLVDIDDRGATVRRVVEERLE